jgi:hypothetical protein
VASSSTFHRLGQSGSVQRSLNNMIPVSIPAVGAVFGLGLTRKVSSVSISTHPGLAHPPSRNLSLHFFFLTAVDLNFGRAVPQVWSPALSSVRMFVHK